MYECMCVCACIWGCGNLCVIVCMWISEGNHGCWSSPFNLFKTYSLVFIAPYDRLGGP